MKPIVYLAYPTSKRLQYMNAFHETVREKQRDSFIHRLYMYYNIFDVGYLFPSVGVGSIYLVDRNRKSKKYI